MITGGNMNLLLSLGKVFVLFAVVSAKPVLQKDGPPPIDVHEDINDEVKDHTGLSYDRYLKEVVYALEEDPEFKKKLESANVSYIKSGEIAKHLDLVGHHIRTKLDEIKRREVQRLLELRRLQMRQMQGVDKMHIPNHLDIGNPHSFEMKDLEKLVKQTTRDIEELDKQRDLEFKQYEMEKEFERKKHLAELPEDERKKEMEKLEELKKKHEQHPRVNHPGSKDQFEEVWHEEDHIDKEQAFDPKSFFKLHDTTGDGVWDIQEVEALLNHELGKVYDDRNPSEEDDPYEREHERMRMRQHIMSEMDKNHDQLITKEEFLNYTGAKGENEEFKKDEGWKLQEEDDLFSDDEYQKFIQQYHAGEAQPGVVQHLGDPNVVNMHQASMGHPGGIDPNLQYQGQHPQGYQPPADHPAQFGQPLHPEQQQQLHHAYLQQQAQMAANLADNAARMNQQFAHTGQQMPGGQQPVPVQHLDPQHQQQLHQQQLHQQQLHQQQQHQVNQQEQQVNQQQQHNEQQAQQAQHQTGQQEQPQTGQQVHAQQPVEQQQQQQQQAQAQQPVEQQHQQQQQQAQQQGQPQGQPQGQQQPVQMNQANAQPPHA